MSRSQNKLKPMSRVLTFSRTYPSYHPKAGQPTYFVEKVLNSLGYRITKSDLLPGVSDIVNDFFLIDGEQMKHHTIRAGHRFKVGDKFSPRVWAGKPYRSKMIQFAPDIEVKKVWNFEIYHINDPIYSAMILDGKTLFDIERGNCYLAYMHIAELIANNDGLDFIDFQEWFQFGDKPFDGQIICWNENINY
jgi:hypothetical protein